MPPTSRSPLEKSRVLSLRQVGEHGCVGTDIDVADLNVLHALVADGRRRWMAAAENLYHQQLEVAEVFEVTLLHQACQVCVRAP